MDALVDSFPKTGFVCPRAPHPLQHLSLCFFNKERAEEPAMMAQTFNPSTQGAGRWGSVSLVPASSTEWILGQPRRHRESLCERRRRRREGKEGEGIEGGKRKGGGGGRRESAERPLVPEQGFGKGYSLPVAPAQILLMLCFLSLLSPV